MVEYTGYKEANSLLNELEELKISARLRANDLRLIGDTEFGWDEVKYRDMWSRINFAWMLTEYDSRFGDTWKEMLVDVLKEHFGCSGVKSIIDVNFPSYMITDGSVDGYIDHQSTSCESDNGKIFDDMDTLKRFLFCEDSYIQGDNDNH